LQWLLVIARGLALTPAGFISLTWHIMIDMTRSNTEYAIVPWF